MDNYKILAAIVAFNPNIDQLQRNIRAIVPQVDDVIVMDNASQNGEKIEKICLENSIIYWKKTCNEGIAKPLNDVFGYAKGKYDWVITLDQDSVCELDYIKKASRYFSSEKIGIISTVYYEKNFGKIIGTVKEENKYQYVKRVITSAAIVNVKAYEKTCGYDELLFLDYVDFDFSVKIRQAGYKILRMNDSVLTHELGNSSVRHFLIWSFRLSSHSPEREFNIAKSIVIYIRKYYKTENIQRDVLSLCKHFLLAVTYETEKKAKLKSLIKGVVEGMKTPILI
ncbi:MAG: glycosyltransferase [Clostridium sp.]|nr:glycosyltransferase [Roseburia sp.]MCM1432122.1 glycosyltransferase [Muribaculaceae bacterium]MCM1499504.1 glycosyltransferase [Clostridium sp.]